MGLTRTIGDRAAVGVAALVVVIAAAGWLTVARPDRAAGRPAMALADPAYSADFPDPDVLAFRGRYYAFATNSPTANILTLQSADLRTWTPGPDALPRLAAWASDYGFLRLTWAPSVLQAGSGFVMYYTTGNPYTGEQCISSARAASPLGPYTDRSRGPIVCQYFYGGDIDPSVFSDGGRRYLMWKSDGNCCGKPTFLWSQELDAGGRLVGHPSALLVDDQAWEGGVVEAPSMVRDHAVYYLFFSANRFDTTRYAIGYAVCASPLGPCAQPRNGPVLASTGDAVGPGGQEFFRAADGELVMCFSAMSPAAGGTGSRSVRTMRLARVSFRDGLPVISDRTATGGSDR